MAVWGGSFVASKLGLDGMYPIELATLRFAIATPMLLLMTVAFFGWKSLKVDRKHLLVLFVLAMTGITLQYIVQLVAMTYTTVTNTVLLINMGTFFVLIPSALFLKVRFTADNILGVAIAFIGAALIITNGSLGLTANIIGDSLVIVSALLWADLRPHREPAGRQSLGAHPAQLHLHLRLPGAVAVLCHHATP